MKYRLAIIGFGTVGQGFAEILCEKKKWLKTKYGNDFDVVAISDPVKGAIYNKKGLNLSIILESVKKGDRISYTDGISGWDSIKTIKETNADIIIEATPTNIKDGEPGLSHIKTAIKNKKHVITTNKGPIALEWKELKELAKNNNVELRFEGTVLSGTPAINLGLQELAGIKIKEVRGILNGTTNFILTQMFNEKSYADALKEAQILGYAEANPEFDVEGWDAVAKVVILANTVMDADIKINDVQREGITKITIDDVAKAKKENKKYKLIGSISYLEDKIKAKVGPEKISPDDFLYSVDGVMNALTFSTDDLGKITIIGPGAGRKETGFAILTDLINLTNKFTNKSQYL